MNRLKLQKILGMAILALFLYSCDNSNEDPDPCGNGPEISITSVIATVDGKETGEIAAEATAGSGSYMFSIDGVNFQGSGTFSNLAADDYSIVVKDANECTDTDMATVVSVPEVFYSNQIKPIIDANCQRSPCHGSNGSIPSFATYNDTKLNAQGIKFRTGNGTMPPSGPLPDSEIELIANWVDQGAPNN